MCRQFASLLAPATSLHRRVKFSVRIVRASLVEARVNDRHLLCSPKGAAHVILMCLVRSARRLWPQCRHFSSQELVLPKLISNKVVWDRMLERCKPGTRQSLVAVAADMKELEKLQQGTSGDDREIAAEMTALLQRLQRLSPLVTQDLLLSNEDNGVTKVLLELSSGVGGQEAMLFADELARLYQQFVANQGWEFSVVTSDRSDLDGIRSLAAQVEGDACFKLLRHEAGVHRVQRIPKTEKSGRVHTSTVAVTVIPVLRTPDQQLLPRDIRITTSRSSGAGGQHVNKTESCVIVTHLPTGLAVECQEERSQIANREKAMQRLQQLLLLRQKEQILAEYESRKSVQVTSLTRSEKIRTYNYPQDRVTDHRLKESLFDLKSFMRGTDGRLLSLMQRLSHLSEQEYLREVIETLEA